MESERSHDSEQQIDDDGLAHLRDVVRDLFPDSELSDDELLTAMHDDVDVSDTLSAEQQETLQELRDVLGGVDINQADAAALASNLLGKIKAVPRGKRTKQVRRDGPRVGRNEPCPCGSGHKFKKCCLRDKK